MRIYDYMKGILGAMGVGEDVGVPEPSWRIEEYLKAIYDKLKEGGGNLPSVTEADNGKVMAVVDGEWEPSLIPFDDEKIEQSVDAWLDDHPEATTTVQDGSITNAKLASSFVTPGAAAAYSSSATYAVGDYVFYGGTLYRCNTAITTAETWTAAHWTAAVLGDDVGELKSTMDYVAEIAQYDDSFGNNLAIAAQYEIRTFSWSSAEKTLSLACAVDTIPSSKTGWAVVTPKTQANHNYVLAVQFSSTHTGASLTYIRNLESPYNFNVGQRISEATAYTDGATQVFKFTATSAGWLAFGISMVAGIEYTTGLKLALYDVTDTNTDSITDDEWLQFSDTVNAIGGGIITEVMRKNNYSFNLVDNVIGEKWSALGDSLTASGSGGFYLNYVINSLGLASYKNCGIGGTMVSGATSAQSMYQDVRIEALDINSDCVTIMGGTNDAWQYYYALHPSTNMTGWGEVTRDNHDVSTFVGAYNVMLSKILYKFCRVPAYYQDVDYSGLTQVSTAKSNFRIILLTPPQMYYYSGSPMPETTTKEGNKESHSYVKQIAEMWGLPCVDTWEMGMNDMNKPLFFANYQTDSTHFNVFGHERLASLLIDKALQVSRYK